ncbi:hypothetical protein [Lacibacter sp.]|nr:hypothetical protein [Lacibacter sp.]HLP37189.1 hypothetical protein [Lacibacter sp.]
MIKHTAVITGGFSEKDGKEYIITNRHKARQNNDINISKEE